MNVITYACGHLLYSDGTTVMSKLNKHMGFGNVVSVESNLQIEQYGEIWKDGNLTLLNYHKEVKKLRYRDTGLHEMPPLSRALIEKLSLDRCHLYNMHRDETLTFRELDKEIMDCFQYWNCILDIFGIDLFICHGFPHAIYTYSLYAICKARNIKVLYIARACVPGYTYINDDLYKNFEKLETAYKQALTMKEPYGLSDYMLNSYVIPMENDSYQWVKIKKDKGIGSYKEEKGLLKNLLHISRWGELIAQIRTDLRKRSHKKRLPKKTDKYYRKLSRAPDYSKRYIYVPLQMQPESTTSPMGNIFVDLLLMIKILAHCVKDTDIQLYIKEHNAQTKVPRLSRSKLYEHILQLPNTHLINKEESSFKLQENCITTATCSGTVVMESMFKNKPVLVFGNRIHNLAPSAIVVSDAESCAAAIDNILSGKFSIGKKERDAFLYAVERACFRGFWFVVYSGIFGISRDEAADNVLAELKALLS